MKKPSDFELWTGEYDKKWYDVLLSPDGVIEIIPCCWPNAGKMVAMDGSGRMWSVEDKIKIREALFKPWET